MTAKITHSLVIRIKNAGDGLLAAYSDDLPGFFLTYPNRERIVDAIPEAVRVLWKAQYGEDVKVILMESPSASPSVKEEQISVAAIPHEVLQQLRQR